MVGSELGGGGSAVRRWIWANGLSLVMFGCFAIFLILQSIFGWHANNADLVGHNMPQESYLSYVFSGQFAEATFENWESEFLQMGFYVLLTAFLVQKGSAESKEIKTDHAGRAANSTSRTRRGILERIYANSLAIALLGLFALSFVAHLAGGTAAFNEEQELHGGDRVNMLQFLRNSEFWFQSMQNWQSEFLAVGALIVLSIFLRQQGSSQSKKVGDPDSKTGTD